MTQNRAFEACQSVSKPMTSLFHEVYDNNLYQKNNLQKQGTNNDNLFPRNMALFVRREHFLT